MASRTRIRLAAGSVVLAAVAWASPASAVEVTSQTVDSVSAYSSTAVIDMRFNDTTPPPFNYNGIGGAALKSCERTAASGVFCLDGDTIRNWPNPKLSDPSRVVMACSSALSDSKATCSGIAVQCHAGNGVMIGHLPDRCSTAQEAAAVLGPLRHQGEQSGGSLVVLACDDDWKSRISLFGTPRPAAPLESRIKAVLDPHHLLNPRRLG